VAPQRPTSGPSRSRSRRLSGDLAGQDATFEITVHEVKPSACPSSMTTSAAEGSEFDTLAELRETIAGRLRHADEHAVEREFEEAVIEGRHHRTRTSTCPRR